MYIAYVLKVTLLECIRCLLYEPLYPNFFPGQSIVLPSSLLLEDQGLSDCLSSSCRIAQNTARPFPFGVSHTKTLSLSLSQCVTRRWTLSTLFLPKKTTEASSPFLYKFHVRLSFLLPSHIPILLWYNDSALREKKRNSLCYAKRELCVKRFWSLILFS